MAETDFLKGLISGGNDTMTVPRDAFGRERDGGSRPDQNRAPRKPAAAPAQSFSATAFDIQRHATPAPLSSRRV